MPRADHPWLVLIHDPDADDPKLLLATVTEVAPAWPRVNAASLAEASAWAAARAGVHAVALVPVPGVTVWTLVRQP
jgi:hypothetical protein